MKKKYLIIAAVVVSITGLGIGYFTLSVIYTYKNKGSEIKNNDQESTAPRNDYQNDSSSTDVVKIIFIHHSTGENWLSDSDGQLGQELKENNYFVSDTNYGWGPNSIGDQTDIGHWWLWFRSPESSSYLQELYSESNKSSDYSRLSNDPGGENEIIMFKSCFPNSNLSGSVEDTIPSIENNFLKGEDSNSSAHTISNAKGIYIDLLQYFDDRQDKLFIVITAPPLGRNNTTSENADNAREFNNWLVNDWLDGYDHSNVVVFDFYDVLTDHGKSNYAEFTYDESDDHPSSEGNLKATEEFIPFINDVYKKWKGN
jgi:hypothetical protein